MWLLCSPHQEKMEHKHHLVAYSQQHHHIQGASWSKKFISHALIFILLKEHNIYESALYPAAAAVCACVCVCMFHVSQALAVLFWWSFTSLS